jgi:PT repeat
MSTHRPRRIDRTTAEQLLRGEPVDPTGGPDPLAALLAAAAAPARADELAGEYAALAAFREAHLGPVLQPRRTSMIKTALAKLLTVKLAAAAVGVTTLGGVALAAGTGTLPTSPRHETTTSHPKPAHATGKPSTAPTHESKSKASPSPSLFGLCHAYTAGAGSEHGKALESPAFTALITAAGGKSNVAAYCTAVIAAGPGKSGTHPTGKPTTQPTDHPTGKPTDHPTGGPTTRPSN